MKLKIHIKLNDGEAFEFEVESYRVEFFLDGISIRYSLDEPELFCFSNIKELTIKPIKG